MWASGGDTPKERGEGSLLVGVCVCVREGGGVYLTKYLVLRTYAQASMKMTGMCTN